MPFSSSPSGIKATSLMHIFAFESLDVSYLSLISIRVPSTGQVKTGIFAEKMKKQESI